MANKALLLSKNYETALSECIKVCQNTNLENEHAKTLATLLLKLACQIHKYANINTTMTPKILQKHMVFACLENINKYNPEKGKAFNYFTTIMLNFLKKEYKIWHNRQSLAKKYKGLL